MSTLELRKRIKKRIDKAQESTLEQIESYLDQELPDTPAFRAYLNRMPQDLEQGVLESEEDIKHGRVISSEQLKKEIGKWRKKYSK